MTYQEKVEWLKSYQIIDAKIGSLTDELQVWNNRATKITTSFSSEPKAAGGGDQLQKCVDKICELQEELARKCSCSKVADKRSKERSTRWKTNASAACCS